jgi:hypothetical protein
VNGKSAIEWIMERYQVTTNKDSGIVNDPNDWAREQGNPKYILDLLLSIINVSLQTVEIVRNLPALDLASCRRQTNRGQSQNNITAPASIPTEVPQSNTVKEYAILPNHSSSSRSQTERRTGHKNRNAHYQKSLFRCHSFGHEKGGITVS